jgi:BRO1-like domain
MAHSPLSIIILVRFLALKQLYLMLCCRGDRNQHLEFALYSHEHRNCDCVMSTTIASLSNLLTIPFKKTYQLNIEDAARRYIYDHGGGHPDEFKADINQWQRLRKDAVAREPVHDSQIKSVLLSVGILAFYRYHTTKDDVYKVIMHNLYPF